MRRMMKEGQNERKRDKEWIEGVRKGNEEGKIIENN